MIKRNTGLIILLVMLVAAITVFAACGTSDSSSDSKDRGKETKDGVEAVVDGDDEGNAEIDNNNSTSDEKSDASDTPSDESNNDEQSQETIDPALIIPEDTPENEIENTYFEFKYYDEWKDNVRFETVDEERYEIRCYGVGAIEGFHSFSIVFADCEGMPDHYYMGTLDGTPVYTYVNQNYDGLSEEQINLLNETVLSYYMNDLTYQLKDAEGFVTKR